MIPCEFGPECIAAQENRNRRPDRATRLVVTCRTDDLTQDETFRLCVGCAKRFVGGSIEVNNGPHIITVVRLE